MLALFYFKTKSPKDITIRPVEGRDVVSELTECANAGEPSQELVTHVVETQNVWYLN